MVRLIIWNFVSCVELIVFVDVIEYISNVFFKVLYFKYLIYLGVLGGGLIRDMFLFEYLVFFVIM